MKNIIQLQNDLRSVPLKNLIFYVQNPSGEVPSYLALSEIKRRKDMEQRANTQQPSSLSVAEELTAPRQNIGPEFDTAQTMLAAQKNAQANMMPTKTMNQGVASLPVPDDMYQDQNFATGGIVSFAGRAGSYVQADDPYGEIYSSDLERALALKQYELDKKKRLKDKTFPGFLFTPPTKLEQFDINALAAKVGKGGYDSTLESPSLTPAEVAMKKNIEDARKNPIQGKNPEVNDYGQETVKNIGEYAKELQDFLGPDKTVALQRERLAKMESRAKRMEDRAPGMAMLEAGLDIASGTSPYAFVNFGRGKSGVKSYAEAQDKLINLEEKRLNLATNIDQAQRREQVAVAEFGAKSKQAVEERNFKSKLQKQHDKVLMAMNTDDNIKAFQIAQYKNQPDITQTLKLHDYIESKLPKEIELILEDLGGNAATPGTKNHSKYLDRMEKAKIKLATQGRTIPGLSSVLGSPVTTKRAEFLGFE